MKPEKGIILVTGSSGLIGDAVMRRLRGQFKDVVGFDRKAASPPPPDCVYIPVDITSDQSVQEGLNTLRDHHGTHISSVIHLAAYYDFLGKPNPKYDQITLGGTSRLIRELQKRFEVEQFVFASTMLVHSPVEPGQFITESSSIGPTWAYPESKVRTEKLIQAERGNIPAVLLRIAGVYDDDCHSPPLSNQIQRLYERQFAGRLYTGATSHGQSFIHLDDLVEAIELVVKRRSKLPPELPLLLGEPDTLSYDELQHTFLRLIYGESWETRSAPGAIAKVGAWIQNHIPGRDPFIKPWMIDRANDHYALNITRARTLLDWAPIHSLRQTLPKMVAALKADPLGWYRENNLKPPASLVKQSHTEQSSRKQAPKNHKDTDHETSSAEQSTAHSSMTYTCPMHPEVENNEPGNCPKCGMTLKAGDVPVKSNADHPDMMVEGHRKMLWPHYVNLMLGVWLLTSPFALGYLSDFTPNANLLRVMAERGLSSFATRNLMMTWSDVLSGILIVIFSWLAANPSRRYPWAQWANTAVGSWLLFAPLVFWTPLPAAYTNATLVGSLVIAFSVLVPMMPGMSMSGMMGGPDVPPGWAYTPSSWLQRMPIAALALVGFFIARYMVAYQLGYINNAWDPFFSSGTETVITSDASKAWPIADAGLGAVVYMFELLMTLMGGKTRWRTMPWMTLGLGVLILPLGIVSIVFIIIQPIVIGTWCTLCLITALAMLIMIPYSLDEFVAMGQFLVDARRKGKPFWRTFFTGGAMEGGSDDSSIGVLGTARDWVKESARGISLPVTLLLSTAIGVWFMFTRTTLGHSDAMANSDHLVGALVVTFSIIAFSEVARSARFINILFGAWLIIAPWLLTGSTSSLTALNGAVSGVLLIALTIPRGTIRDSYGSWDRYIV